jgi:N6-L-threonylcarbamoyladenine synthase
VILGIESSCDESALALYDPESGILGEWINSQIIKHSEYGGVVPDLAVSEHLNNFIPLLSIVREKYDLTDLVSKIAVTCGPGLVGCLGVGISIGKSLSLLWNVPLVGVNHLRGHAFSPFIPHSKNGMIQWSKYLPHLGLLVSGGNTLLFEIDEELNVIILAKTVDDAAGEALDKGAKLLGIPYPGAPILEKKAKNGNHRKYDFPIAFPERNKMKFSFSGLKTSLLYKLEKMTSEDIKNEYADLCASYQWAAVQQLLRKTDHAMNNKKYMSIGLSGGVSNNQLLRDQMKQYASTVGTEVLFAEPRHSGDNATMIAFAAHIDGGNTWSNLEQELCFNPSLKLDNLVV